MVDRRTFLVVFAGVLLAAVPTALAEPAGGRTMDRCTQVTAAQERLQTEVGAMDGELDRKVAAMNAAEGDAKVQAIASLLTELVRQRRVLDADVARVHTALTQDCPTLQGSAARADEETGAMSGVGAPERDGR